MFTDSAAPREPRSPDEPAVSDQPASFVQRFKANYNTSTGVVKDFDTLRGLVANEELRGGARALTDQLAGWARSTKHSEGLRVLAASAVPNAGAAAAAFEALGPVAETIGTWTKPIVTAIGLPASAKKFWKALMDRELKASSRQRYRLGLAGASAKLIIDFAATTATAAKATAALGLTPPLLLTPALGLAPTLVVGIALAGLGAYRAYQQRSRRAEGAADTRPAASPVAARPRGAPAARGSGASALTQLRSALDELESQLSSGASGLEEYARSQIAARVQGIDQLLGGSSSPAYTEAKEALHAAFSEVVKSRQALLTAAEKVRAAGEAL